MHSNVSTGKQVSGGIAKDEIQRNRKRKRKILTIFVATAAASAFAQWAPQSAQATDGTWNVNANGTWSTAGNWLGNSIPDGVGAIGNLTFNLATSGKTVTLDGNRTLGTLNIGDPTSSFQSYTLAQSGGSFLTLNNNGAGAVISKAFGTAADTISAPIIINDSLTIVATPGTLNITGGITSTGGTRNLTLSSNSTGTVTIASMVDISGNITNNGNGTNTTTITGGVSGSVTSINQNSTTSALTISGGGLAVNAGGTTLLNTAGTKALTISSDVSGTGNLTASVGSNLTGGNIALSGNVSNTGYVISSGSGNQSVVISGNITSSVLGVIQNGAASTLVLGGNNTFSGNVAINAGTVYSSSTLGLGAGTTYIGETGSSADAALLGLAGNITVPIIVQSGPGARTLGNNGSSASVFSGLVTLNGNLTIASSGTGTVNLNGGVVGAALAGSKDITITSATPAATNVTLGGNNSGFTGSVKISSGSLKMGSVTALSSVNTVSINAGATFDLSQNSVTIAGLNDITGFTAGNVTNTGANVRVLTLGGSGIYSFSGNISPATATRVGLNIALTGSGQQTLSNSNTYAGGTTVTTGTLNLTANGAMGGGGFLSVIDGTLNLNSTTQTATTVTVSGSGSILGGATSQLTGTSFTFSNPSGTSTATAVLAGTGATLSKSGAGTTILSGANTYTGASTLSAGTVVLGNKTALGIGGTISFGSMTTTASTDLSGSNAIVNSFTTTTGTAFAGTNSLELSAAYSVNGASRVITNNITVGNLTLSGNQVIDNAARSITYSGAGNLIVSGNITASAGGGLVIYNSDSLSTLLLSGLGNNFAGTSGLTVDSGTVRITGLNTSTAPIVRMDGGNTILDMTGTGTSRWSSTMLPTMAGGTLTVRGNTSGTSAQSMGNVTYDGGHSTIIVDSNGGAGTTLTTGNFTRTNSGTMLIDLSSANSAMAVTATPTLNNSLILAGTVTVKDSGGYGFATVSSGNVIKYTGATQLTSGVAATNLDGNTNYYLDAAASGNLTLSGSNSTQAINTLDIRAGSSGPHTLDLGGKALFNATGAQAILMTGSSDFTITNGALGIPSTDFLLYQYGTGILTLSVNSVSGGASSGSVTKMGSGTVIMSGTNVYSSPTRIREGVLEAIDGVSLPSTSGLYLSGGVLQSNGTLTRSLSTSGGGLRFGELVAYEAGNGAGFSARGGNFTIQINNGTASLAWGITNFIRDGKALMFGSNTADSMVDFQNGLGLGGLRREINVVDNASVTTDFARLSGVLSSTSNGGSTAGGLLKTGNGTLQITGNSNTYAGNTDIFAGRLLVDNTSGSALGTGDVTLAAGATIGGSGSFTGKLTTAGTTAVISPGSSPGNLTMGSLDASAGARMKFELGNADSAVSDHLIITGAMTGSTSAGGLVMDIGAWGFGVNGPQTGVTYTLVSFDIDTDLNDSDFTAVMGYGLTLSTSFGGSDGFLINHDSTVGSGVGSIQIQFSAVPEPTSLSLLGMGAGGLLARRRRKRSVSARQQIS